VNDDKLAKHKKILVIKLGALGDMVLCARAFQAIQQAHPKAEIALLTTPQFVSFAKNSKWFDSVIEDPRAPKWDLGAWLKLRQRVTDFGPTRVYDLQAKTRQNILYFLLGGPLSKVEWSGSAPGCTFARPWPPQPETHYTEFVANQLRATGIDQITEPELAWLDAPTEKFNLPQKFALLIPGSSLQHSYKRWSAANYAALIKKLAARGLQTVLVGARGDETQLAMIKHLAPDVVNLANKTSLYELAGIARRASVVIGNDTGPTHVAAAVGTPTVTLFSERVDPSWAAPRGKLVKVLQGKPSIDSLTPDQVFEAVPA
jgi:ADP-heptose:LPS heptosyltransferase